MNATPVPACRTVALAAVMWLAAVVGGLVGCGTSPETQFITLETTMPQGRVTPVAGPPVSVGAVRLPPALQRQALVLRAGDNRLEMVETVRWPAALPVLVRRTLALDLAARLPRDKVVLPDQPDPAGPLRLFIVTIETFSADDANQVTLEAHWSLIDTDSRTTRINRESRITVPTASTRGPDVAAAMSEALGQLADQMVRALGEM